MTAPPLSPVGPSCVELRCAHQVDPLGVAPDRVRLSWRLEGTGTGRSPARLPGAGHTGRAGYLRGMGQRPSGVSGDGGHRLRGHPADRGRPVQLEGAGLGRDRVGVRLERPGPLRGRTGPNERVARLLDRPASGPGERHPAVRRGAGRPGGESPDPGSLPAPGLHRRSAGDVRPAVRDRARPVRGAAERPPGWRRVPHSRLDRLHPAHRLPDLRRDGAAQPGR